MVTAQEWLNECYNWVVEEYHLDAAAQMDEIIRHIDVQLLESDLRDSMVPETGLPQVSADVKDTVIRGPVLVQVLSIMDIGQSAFSLMNVRQARLERADMAGLARAEDDEDEGPIPSYPRSMLRLELTDGSISLPAVEHRRLPELKLGESKLGLKVSEQAYSLLVPARVPFDRFVCAPPCVCTRLRTLFLPLPSLCSQRDTCLSR